MSSFGENLRKIRIERGMSQEELATLLGTSKQVISRYETGQRSPKVTIVAEYADKLGVAISALTSNVFDYLKQGLSPSPTASAMLRKTWDGLPDYGGGDPDLDALLQAYDGLNDRGRADLLKYARYLSADPDMTQDGASNTTTA